MIDEDFNFMLADLQCRHCSAPFTDPNAYLPTGQQAAYDPQKFCNTACYEQHLKETRRTAPARVRDFLEAQLAKGNDIRKYLGSHWDLPVEFNPVALAETASDPDPLTQEVIEEFKQRVGWVAGWDAPEPSRRRRIWFKAPSLFDGSPNGKPRKGITNA